MLTCTVDPYKFIRDGITSANQMRYFTVFKGQWIKKAPKMQMVIHFLFQPPLYSSPEHKVLKVSYCDHPVSIVHALCVVHRQHLPFSPSRGHSFASIFMKLYLNVCLDISVKFEYGLCRVKNQVTRSNFFKTLFTLY